VIRLMTVNLQPLLFHFCNINSFLGKKKQVKTCLLQSPRAVAAGFCEVKLPCEASSLKTSLRIPGFSEYNVFYKRMSSGLLLYINNRFIHNFLASRTVEVEGCLAAFVEVSTVMFVLLPL
jgi:hypothetical protein